MTVDEINEMISLKDQIGKKWNLKSKEPLDFMKERVEEEEKIEEGKGNRQLKIKGTKIKTGEKRKTNGQKRKTKRAEGTKNKRRKEPI